jgi:acyl carrier protein
VTRAEIAAMVLKALSGIAPEIDPASVRPEAPLRDQVDLDSIDYLNFMIAIHAVSGVDIPEADYAKLNTVNETVEYLAQRMTR